MNVLIAVATRHGSTRGIAEAIADELRSKGIVTHVRDIHEIAVLDHHDAVIVGSAIYMGNWLSDARDFVNREQEQLSRVPVWLFSSGPLGDDHPDDMGVPNHLDELMAKTSARGHQVFAGTLDKSRLNLRERMVSRVVNAPEGDFRDWNAIHAWADEIATALEPQTTAAGTS